MTEEERSEIREVIYTILGEGSWDVAKAVAPLIEDEVFEYVGETTDDEYSLDDICVCSDIAIAIENVLVERLEKTL